VNYHPHSKGQLVCKQSNNNEFVNTSNNKQQEVCKDIEEYRLRENQNQMEIQIIAINVPEVQSNRKEILY